MPDEEINKKAEKIPLQRTFKSIIAQNLPTLQHG